jgi:4-amino-4-deoxy-L-arabinose transferase-like glycosyltransferase
MVPRRQILIVLAAALLWRLLIWWQPLHMAANDEVEYLTVARDLLAGRGWRFYEQYHWLRAPLYPLFLAGSLALFGGDPWLAALPNILLSTLNVWLIYRISIALDDDAPAWRHLAAAWTAALLQTFATFATLWMLETLFTACFSAGMLLLLEWRRRGRDLRWAAAAGFCFGLALLTRSAPLYALLPISLWIAWQARSTPTLRVLLQPRTWLPALLVPLIALTLVVPWTLRNCRAYSACILIETGLSYNLWAFSEPREDMATIFRELEQIADPAERADYATARGIARLQEDPAILLRKILPNWQAVWRIKAIQDRFIMADYRSDPPPALFLSALILDDLLLLIIVPAGVAALTAAVLRGRPAAWLLGVWFAYVIAVTLVTHGEGRYRHFFLFALIPYAWRLLPGLRLPQRLQPPQLTALLAAAVVSGTMLAAYHWEYARAGALRSLAQSAADALSPFNPAAAAVAARAADQADPSPDTAIAAGDAALRLADSTAAEQWYRSAVARGYAYPPPHVRLALLLLAQGRTEEARTALQPTYVSDAAIIAEAWLRRSDRPTDVDVGAGLDAGLIRGVYAAEPLGGTTARWSDGTARLRLPPQGGRLSVRVAALRSDIAQLDLTLCTAAGCTVTPLPAGVWRTLSVFVPPAADAASAELELRSPTFAAPDGRTLGVAIDWYTVSIPAVNQ